MNSKLFEILTKRMSLEWLTSSLRFSRTTSNSSRVDVSTLSHDAVREFLDLTLKLANLIQGNFKFDESMMECLGTIRRNVDQSQLGIEGDGLLNVEIFKLCLQKSKAPYFFESNNDLTEDEESFLSLRSMIQHLILDVSFKEPNFEQIVEVLSQALQSTIEDQCEDQALNIEAVLDVFSSFLSSFSQTHVSLVNNQERQLVEFFFSDVLKQTCASANAH